MSKPKVIIFNGVSLDGRMDGRLGAIDMGLYYGLADTWKADAMLSGSATMLEAFAGEETQEIPEGPTALHPLAVPYLVIVDSQGQIHSWQQIKAQPFWDKVVVLCSAATPGAYLDELEAEGIPFITTGEKHVDFRIALEELNTRFGIHTVRLDSGGVLNGVLLRTGLVDEVSILLDPVLVGGTSPNSLFIAEDIASTEQSIPLRLIHYELVKEDVLWLRYEVRK